MKNSVYGALRSLRKVFRRSSVIDTAKVLRGLEFLFSEEMKTLFEIRPAGIATVDSKNRPDVETSPVKVYDDKTLIFPEFDEESKTLKNLRENPEVAVIAWSGKLLRFGRNKAYKFRGKAEIHENGPFFNIYKENKPRFVVSVKVEKTFRHESGKGFWVEVE